MSRLFLAVAQSSGIQPAVLEELKRQHLPFPESFELIATLPHPEQMDENVKNEQIRIYSVKQQSNRMSNQP
jgi:hypothetical protein